MKLPDLPDATFIVDMNGYEQMMFDEYDMLKFQQDTINACIELITKEQEHAEQNWRCKDGVHITWKLKEME